ncbi:TadE/TadG family type IV pilus assembly protein [Shewanella atlantica]|uniref:Pilus assembly protein n=1 Tax=Shewanella atlantica TaxID=271099 RepID=A0A431WDN7_9GAMM|nr:TadE/TadG family type IV pilus assembly protein [Shewanella atlantica]RTR33367.1 pilus assembly protein [Shewanella atlantica]
MTKQKGVYSVEFAIVGGLFLMLLFAIIEIGRLMYTYNVLHEASRRAARIAVVCRINDADLQNMALFDGVDLVPNLAGTNLIISYVDSSGADTTGVGIAMVRADIVNYQHQFLIPGFDRIIDSPTFTTSLPRESFGVYNPGTSGKSGLIDCN